MIIKKKSKRTHGIIFISCDSKITSASSWITKRRFLSKTDLQLRFLLSQFWKKKEDELYILIFYHWFGRPCKNIYIYIFFLSKDFSSKEMDFWRNLEIQGRIPIRSIRKGREQHHLVTKQRRKTRNSTTRMYINTIALYKGWSEGTGNLLLNTIFEKLYTCVIWEREINRPGSADTKKIYHLPSKVKIWGKENMKDISPYQIVLAVPG